MPKSKMIRTDCKRNCQGCTNIPLELVSDSEIVDILIIDRAPRKSDLKSDVPLSGGSGRSIKKIIAHLQEKHDFTFAITNNIKNYSQENTEYEFTKCKHILKHEIKRHKPKIIILLGERVHNYYWKTPNNWAVIEENCVRKLKFFGKTYDTITSVHPIWSMGIDANGIGFTYAVIEKAILHLKNVKFKIPNKFTTTYLDTIPKVKKVLQSMIKSNNKIGVDTETKNLGRVYGNNLLSIQLCNDGKDAYIIPWNHYDSPFDPKDIKRLTKMFVQFFTGKTKVSGYLFANTKFDIHQFFREMHIFNYNAPLIDVSFNEYLLEENWGRFGLKFFPKGKGPYSLFTISYKYGFRFYVDTDETNKDDRHNLANIPIKDWVNYACADVAVLPNIWKVQLKRAKYQNYLTGFKKMAIKFSHSVARVLTYIEHCGIPINIDTLRYMYNPRTAPLLKQQKLIKEEFSTFKSVKLCNKRLRKADIGISQTLFSNPSYFDIGKKDHREMLFFDVLDLPENDEGKLSTDKNFQAKYKHIEEVALLKDYNRMKTLQGLQIDNIYDFMNKNTGRPDFYSDYRIRSSYFPTTATGRLRSIQPNGQQRVSHGDRAEDILKMYESSYGKCFLKIDYSTFEVMGLGFVSEDEGLMESFNKMAKIKRDYRLDPFKFLLNSDKKKPKTLLSILNKKLSTKEKWKSTSLAKLVPNWIDDSNVPLDNKVKSNFIKYTLFQINKKKVWKTTNLKKRFKTLVKVELRRLLALINVKNQTDIHKRSAALFNSIPVEDVDGDMRTNAKGFVFGMVYGRGIPSIADELGISLEEAKDLAKLFADGMPGAFEWMQEIQKLAQEQYFVESGLGRRRHLWGFFSTYGSDIAKMRRLSMNTIIQGICSDLNIIGTDNVISFIEEQGKLKYQVPDSDAWLIHNLVHDSSEMEVPVKDVRFIIENFEAYYTNKLHDYILEEYGYDIKIGVEIDFEVGIRYSDIQSWDGTTYDLDRLIEWVEWEDSHRVSIVEQMENEAKQ